MFRAPFLNGLWQILFINIQLTNKVLTTTQRTSANICQDQTRSTKGTPKINAKSKVVDENILNQILTNVKPEANYSYE